MYALAWMGDVLRLAGCTVVETPEWQDRGRSEFGPAKGVLIHHTAGPLAGNIPSLNTLVKGRGDLPGPLCNLAVGRDGTFYTVAAGRSNHAGKGLWHGVSNGNGQFIGIECENTGLVNDQPWPTMQLAAMVTGVAALVKHIGCNVDMVAGHKEYALPKGRKPDPSFNMDVFRSHIMNKLGGIPMSLHTVPYRVTGTDRLVMRKTPAGDVMGHLPSGTVVGVIGEDNGWSHVQTPAHYVGWVSSHYLEKVPINAHS